MRLFCGNEICPSTKSGTEIHVFWISAMGSPFRLKVDKSNPHNTCLGYFYTFYNDPNECPKVDVNRTSSVCKYDPAVQLLPFGMTEETLKNSQCGFSAINNLIMEGHPYFNGMFNAGDSKGFTNLTNSLKKEGYSYGFSLAALAYDFRKFIHSNSNISASFNKLVNMLYSQTGKKVIILAHSLGSNNSLKLINDLDDNLRNKIKRFVAIGPPFAGASKVLEFMTKSSADFKANVGNMEFDIKPLGQKLFIPFTPFSYELSPKAVFTGLTKDPRYTDFIYAILERINLEKAIDHDDNINEEYIRSHSVLFNKLFPFMPKLNDLECDLEKWDLKQRELVEKRKKYESNHLALLPVYAPCRMRMFDLINCPLVRTSKVNIENYNFDEFCDKKNSDSQYFLKECTSCNNLNTFYEDFTKDFKHDHDHKNLVKEANLNNTISPVEDDYDFIENVATKMFEYQKLNDKIKNSPGPKVPTTIVYASFLDTRTAYNYDKKKSDTFTKDEVLMFGGDGTVPTYSSLLTGLKWIYERDFLNMTETNEVQIVEYCSLLANNPKTKIDFTDNKFLKQPYLHLGCTCLRNGNDWDVERLMTGDTTCSHESLVIDPILIEFIFNVVSQENVDPKEKEYEAAVEIYESINYEHKCNKILLKANTEKRSTLFNRKLSNNNLRKKN